MQFKRLITSKKKVIKIKLKKKTDLNYDCGVFGIYEQ